MQIRVGPSRSIVYQPPEILTPVLLKEFTYTNSSVSYKLYQHKSNRFKIINKLLHTVAMNETEAAKIWQDEKDALEAQVKVSLIQTTSDGMIVFPTGLLQRLLKICKENEIDTTHSVVDCRKQPKETQGFAVQGKAELRTYQRKAVECLIQAGQGTMVAGTGTGKTVVIQELIKRLGHKTVLIVPSLSIMNQTIARFQKYFGRGMVGGFGGGKKISVNKQGKPILKDITIACAPSLAKTDAKTWEEVDVVIADECHHTPCKTIETIFFKVLPRQYYRFGFTATNFRNDGADLAIEAAVFPPVFTYSVEDGIKDGFLSTPRFIMYEVNRNSYKSYSGKLPVFAYKYHVLRNRYLTDKVVSVANAAMSAGKQVLILVREKEHGYNLFNRIGGSVFVRDTGGGKDDPKCPRTDPDDSVRDFNSGTIRCLIGTSIIGEGTDLIPVEVLLNLMGGKSKLEVTQNIGRGLRRTETKDKVLIVDFIHKTNEMLEKHSYERMKIYKALGDLEVKGF